MGVHLIGDLEISPKTFRACISEACICVCLIGVCLTGVHLIGDLISVCLTGVHVTGAPYGRVPHGRIHYGHAPPGRTPHRRVRYGRVYSRSLTLQTVARWSTCRDLSCKIRVFALKGKRSLWASAMVDMLNTNLISSVLEVCEGESCCRYVSGKRTK
jgi:hypothetical protein